jgi:ribosomal protein L30E
MIIENKVVDNICNYDKNKNGEWIRQCDVYEKNENGKKYLGIKRNKGMQKCDAECVTIAKSCRDLVTNDIEYDKLGSELYKHEKTLIELQTAVCSKWTKRCPKKPKALPTSYNRIDHPFRELSAEAIGNEPIFYMKGQSEDLEDTYTGDL